MEEKRVTIKKCDDCGHTMINNCKLEGQHPHEIGVDGRTNMRVFVPTGEKMNNLFGMEVDKSIKYDVTARFCPNCGKIDLYAVLNK